ncbi:hypothetical protein ACTA71_010742 [Dictyostelium dimigraforme]
MRSILSLLIIVILSYVALSKATDCGKYKNPLTCANMEPPCFWDGKVCKKIYPKNCAEMTMDDCENNKEKGCYLEGENCILSKFFQCLMIRPFLENYYPFQSGSYSKIFFEFLG